MGEEKYYTLILAHLRLFGESQVPIIKKRKLGPKTVDCVFLGYAKHSVGYRFLVVKSEVHDMRVSRIMESRDSTFFEDIFPIRDMQSTLRLEYDETPKPATDGIL